MYAVCVFAQALPPVPAFGNATSVEDFRVWWVGEYARDSMDRRRRSLLKKFNEHLESQACAANVDVPTMLQRLEEERDKRPPLQFVKDYVAKLAKKRGNVSTP